MAIQSNFPAIKPSLLLDFANTKQLDPRITYTRASTASFYNGVTTAKAEENLILQSQTFDNASWSDSATAITRTANTTTAPDGTTTADSAVGDGTTAIHYFGQLFSIVASTNYVFSIYVKSNGLNLVQFFLGAGASYANFDVTSGAGATGTSVGFSSLAIQDAGNGWYRCSFLINEGSTRNGIYIALSNSASAARAPSFSTSSGLFLWGAQLEQRSAVSAYTATTTQAITNYIPALQTAASGVARFDNNPTTGESLGLLIEESRTNLLTYSSQFDNAAYTKISSATITTAANIAPDGTQTAQLFTNGATASRIQTDITVTTSTAYTATIYAKAGNASYLCFGFALAPNSSAIFNLSTGVVSNTAGSPTSTSITAVGNGWYRCSITVTSTSTSIRLIAGASSTNTFTSAIYPNGTTGDTGFIWGAQVEAGAFATSYIPTVASQVTRAADAASMTGTNFSSWYNAGEGTFYGEASSLSGSTFRSLLRAVDNSTANNYFEIGLVTGTNNGVGRFQVNSNGALQWDTGNASTPVFVANTFYKVIAASKVNDFAGSRDSGTVATDTAGTVANNLAIFEIGGRHLSPSNLLNGTIKKIAYYPLRVTNAQLQALTS